jgi:hypothetical protein
MSMTFDTINKRWSFRNNMRAIRPDGKKHRNMRQQDICYHSLWLQKVSTTTVVGKVAFLLHSTVVLILLLSSLWSVADPSSEGTNCALEPFEQEPYTATYLSGLIQLLNWWGIGFFLQSFSCCVKNVVLLVFMLVGASIINTRLTATLVELDPELIPKECFGGLVLFVLVVCAIEGLVLLLILCDVSCATGQVEQRKQNNESIIVSEKTPLTA